MKIGDLGESIFETMNNSASKGMDSENPLFESLLPELSDPSMNPEGDDLASEINEAEAQPGNSLYDLFNLGQYHFHEKRIRGKGVKVAVFDSGLA
mmetsp:Transcript_24365/g.37743  ORF Transcript_24365/g.37743 Transcript_24365/m.37743 type:complete len:95 (+) Transcript_24365:738-1022(+)